MANRVVYLSPNGLAAVKKRLSPGEIERLEKMIQDGRIKIVDAR